MMTVDYWEPLTRVCAECARRFDLTVEEDAQEFYYGHDCEEAE